MWAIEAKIKIYLENEWFGIKKDDYNGKKHEEMLKLLEKIYEMQLLNTVEFDLWKKRLCSIECKDIQVLGLSGRSESQLRYAGIGSCGTLRKLIKGEHNKKNILNIRNIGQVLALEIIQKSVQFGLVQKEELYKNPSKSVAWQNLLSKCGQMCEEK